VASAGRTCMSSMANFQTRVRRSSRVTRSIGRIDAIGPDVEGLSMGERVGVPWLATLAASVHIAACDGKTCVTMPAFTDIPVMGASRRRRSPMRASPFHWRIRQRRIASAIVVRRAHRLAVAEDRWRRQDSWSLRLRRRRSHSLPNRTVAGAIRCLASRAPETSPLSAFARTLGAAWAGGSDETPPELLDAAIIFATVGETRPARAEGCSQRAGVSFAPRIHMSDIPSSPIPLLWEERQLLSVANSHRQDRRRLPAAGAADGQSSRTRRLIR